ncbi:MAG: PAM68 family protein [Leptolyngbyaceae cyanobacterium MO_188.B28]|nr:PAM68 family protein [Leptolyngbyaceae cyanobacterium MO_188.B28]
MASESEANRLPFEPSGKRKKSDESSKKSEGKPSKLDKAASSKKSGDNKKEEGIPPVVSRRMIRRMAILSGVPTFFGVVVFFLSYYLLVNHLLELPTVVVFLTTIGCFGLGVVGISYGVLSASWDEEETGSLLGWSEFTLNLGRLISTRRAAKSKSKS